MNQVLTYIQYWRVPSEEEKHMALLHSSLQPVTFKRFGSREGTSTCSKSELRLVQRKKQQSMWPQQCTQNSVLFLAKLSSSDIILYCMLVTWDSVHWTVMCYCTFKLLWLLAVDTKVSSGMCVWVCTVCLSLLTHTAAHFLFLTLSTWQCGRTH